MLAAQFAAIIHKKKVTFSQSNLNQFRMTKSLSVDNLEQKSDHYLTFVITLLCN